MTPTKFLKHFLPDSHYFHKQKSLRWLSRLTDPNVWHLNRRSVAGGLWIGLFFALQPLPGQIPAAAMIAIWTRANLPLAVISTWLTNPLTFYPIYYFNFSVGCFLLGVDGTWSADGFSISEIFGEAYRLAFPLYLGSFIVSTFTATGVYLLIRLSWRFYVMKRWWTRKTGRRSSIKSP
ncbi:MAG: DUF2062 domain-containing protein [Gammaproteobacteria bacterium]